MTPINTKPIFNTYTNSFEIRLIYNSIYCDRLFTEERYFDRSTSDDSWKCEVCSTINISEISGPRF